MERITALLAVIANVDSRFDLFSKDPLHGDATESIGFGAVDVFAALMADIAVNELGWARQATGVSGENAFLATVHGTQSTGGQMRQPTVGSPAHEPLSWRCAKSSVSDPFPLLPGPLRSGAYGQLGSQIRRELHVWPT